MSKERPVVLKGKNVALTHLENRIKRVRLLTEQAALLEEGRRMNSSQHASEVRKEKVDRSPVRPSRLPIEAARRKEGRERSVSAKPSTQPSTSKEPVRSEVRRETRKSAERPTSKSREMYKSKDSSSYAKRPTASPASSTESIQRLMDEVKRLRDENEKLKGKVEVDLTNSQDLKEWPRKDLLKLIAQLESKEVRKPVQAAVRKLQEMGDTMSLHDQLQLARETVENLKLQNANLQEELDAAKSVSPPPPHPVIRMIPAVPRLDMDWLNNSIDSPAKNGDHGEEVEDVVDEEEEAGENGHGDQTTKQDLYGVITDPALMPRWEYEQIACDIVHATRAAILRKRFMERWKKEREHPERHLKK
ncbi:hypothetical protein PMAYCL1PPCAC_30965 [Pristionchus mayeri]|uniref:Uncharacterized protein n=1 Tax=Pristionchus mayeri TaxID=1317129 RepID=A0AAN5DDN1_9BILA|nr:hypothetical protein PMAYCL1PPCAC_30965 [Pristionchus mayeri]